VDAFKKIGIEKLEAGDVDSGELVDTMLEINPDLSTL